MIGFDFLTPENVEKLNNVVNMVYTILDIIRIVVPIGLITMTSFDIAKKVINPSDQDGQKKIMIRAIAALIVFLLPTLLHIIMRLAGMENDNKIDISKGIKNSVTSTPIPTTNPYAHFSGLSISGCPSSTKTYHKNESITLNTDIPTTYTGDIKWTVIGAEKYINIREMNGGKSVQINVLNVDYDTSTTINVVADGKSSSCKINIGRERLSSVNITNCPTETYLVGSKIELNTDISNSFGGDINWKVDDNAVAKIEESSDKKSSKIELLTRPKTGVVFVTVSAGGVANTCQINIKSVENLEITNCPVNTVFHVGDKITLTSNLPNTYNGPIEWVVSSVNNDFSITPSASKKEAVVEVLSIPSVNYGTAIIAADSKTANCKIKVE